MTTIQSKLNICLTVLSVVLFVFTAGNTIAQPQLSKKEAKALSATAKTKEDHLKLARTALTVISFGRSRCTAPSMAAS